MSSDFSHNLQRLIERTQELRALPVTTRQILELMQNATASASEVLDVVAKDPALTANLLKLANSALFGVGRQIGTVHDALVLLGNRTVLNLAFATGMGPVMAGPLPAYRLESRGLWHHSLAVALGAAHLVEAGAADRWLREQAFTAGLVHDVGKLLLNGPLKEQLEPLPPEAPSHLMLEAERSLLGYDHAEAGGRLADYWHFPTGLVRVIECHHRAGDPETESVSGLLRAVAGADLVATYSGFTGGGAAPTEGDFREEIQRLDLPTDAVDELLERLPADLDALLTLLGAPRR